MTDKQKKITFSDIMETTEECAAEKGIELPGTTAQDLQRHIKVSGISSYKKLHETHQALKAALKDCEIFDQIAFSVRLKLAILLGFSEFTEAPDPLTGVSPQEFLIAFIQSLPDGKSWIPKDLCRWEYKGMKGQTFFTRMSKRIGQMSKEAIINIIGGSALADTLLKRNPLIVQITNVLQAKEYLTQFLETLEDEEEWYAEDLRVWRSTKTPKGGSVWTWITLKFKGFDEDIVRKVLDKDAERLLKRNPYIERDAKTIKEVRESFIEFLGSLKEGEPWEIGNNLRKWKDKNGYMGHSLENRLRQLSDNRDLDTEILKTFLGKDHEHLLTNHPLEKEEKHHYSIEDAKKTMLEFLKSLKENEIWSPKTLQKWGNLGHSLYDWLTRHFRDQNNNPDWKTIVDQFVPAEYKQRNSFKRERIIYKTSKLTGETRDRLLRFLGSLPKGTTWTPKTLDAWSTENNPRNGHSLYQWLSRNIRDKTGIDWQRILREIKSRKHLRRNPFEKELVITSEKIAKNLLIEFLESLPEGQPWSPIALEKWGTKENPRIGDNLRVWLGRNCRHGGDIDWIYILIKIIPQKFLRRNPFHHRTKEFLEERRRTKHGYTKRGPDVSEVEHKIPHPHIPNPEEILTRREENRERRKAITLLRTHIEHLEPEDHSTIMQFLNEEDVDEEQLAEIVEKLRDSIRGVEPEKVAA